VSALSSQGPRRSAEDAAERKEGDDQCGCAGGERDDGGGKQELRPPAGSGAATGQNPATT
jgi:hypothetical protein